MAESHVDTAPEVAAWKEVTFKLLDTTTQHAVRCGAAQVEEFRRVIRDTSAGLREAASSSQVLLAAGALAQAVTHYSVRTQREVDAMHTEMNSTLKIFLEHLERLHSDTASMGLVAEIRELVESASEAGRLAEVHEDVAAKLRALVDHAEGKRKEALTIADNLQDRVAVLQQPPGVRVIVPAAVAAPMDPCTGLPNRMEAEAALQRAIEEGRNAYAAVFYLHRMPLTNARFGEAIGNQVILFCSQHIATTVTRGEDQLFRWSGPAIVAILERNESLSNVSSEVQRFVSAPFSRFFETSSRSVYLPIKMTATVVPLSNTNFAEVSAMIDHFMLLSSGRNQEH
jgi:GGDEF domain-containing protein